MSWQPIETAPRDGTAVDVWCPEGDSGYRVADAYFSKHSHTWFHIGDGGYTWTHQPSHWMPIPDGPNE